MGQGIIYNGEEINYYHLTDLQFSTVCLIDDTGAVMERVTYDAYGKANHRWRADLDGDGDKDSTDENALYDIARFDRAITHADYDADADLDRDGDVDVDDYDLGLADGSQAKLANGSLSQDGVDNLIGFSGYVYNDAPTGWSANGSSIGVYTVRFRHYDTGAMRWLTRDPAGYVDGANLYGYTRGNPIGALDPYGLDTVDDHGGIRDPSTITPIQAPGVGGEDMAAQAGTGNPWVDFWWEHMQVDRTGRFEWDDPGWWNRFKAGAGLAFVEGALRGVRDGLIVIAVAGAGVIIAVAAGVPCVVIGGVLTVLAGVGVVASVPALIDLIRNWDQLTDEEKAEILGYLIGLGLTGRGGLKRLSRRICFAAGTLVLAASGLVGIETVEAGDLVWSVDAETGELELNEVTEVFVTENQMVLELSYVDAAGDQESLTVTPEHPFWTADRGWVAAAELNPGDRLIAAEGEPLAVTGLRLLSERQTVYNLEVEGNHTYLVGDDAVWVHNECTFYPIKPRKGRGNLIKRLLKKGWIIRRPAGRRGRNTWILINPATGQQIRIMPGIRGKPHIDARPGDIGKYGNPYYMRCRPSASDPWGDAVPLGW